MRTRKAGSRDLSHPVGFGVGVFGTACLLAAPAVTIVAVAAEYNYEAGIGLEYTDNVNRAPSGAEREDWILAPYAAGKVESETPDLRIELDGRVSYDAYLRGTNGDTLRGQLSLVSAWEPLPERLVLHLENQLREVPIEERDTLTVDNRERANATLAGPDLIFRLSPVDQLVLGARYGYTHFEESGNNSRRVGAASWEHRLSPRTDMHVDTSYQEVHFEDAAAADYDRVDAQLGFTHQLRRSELRLSGGHYSISREGASDVDGLQGELGWDVTLASGMRLDVSAIHDTFDAGDRLLASGREALALGAISAAVEDDLVTTTRYGAVLRHENGIRDMYVGGSYTDEDFEETDDRDRIVRTARAGASLRLSADYTASIDGQYVELRYRTDGRVDEDIFAGVSVRRIFGRHYFAELGYGLAERESSVAGEGFDENVIRLLFGYARVP